MGRMLIFCTMSFFLRMRYLNGKSQFLSTIIFLGDICCICHIGIRNFDTDTADAVSALISGLSAVGVGLSGLWVIS